MYGNGMFGNGMYGNGGAFEPTGFQGRPPFPVRPAPGGFGGFGGYGFTGNYYGYGYGYGPGFPPQRRGIF